MSAAASITEAPDPFSEAANFATEVVLPVPFTPTTISAEVEAALLKVRDLLESFEFNI